VASTFATTERDHRHNKRCPHFRVSMERWELDSRWNDCEWKSWVRSDLLTSTRLAITSPVKRLWPHVWHLTERCIAAKHLLVGKCPLTIKFPLALEAGGCEVQINGDIFVPAKVPTPSVTIVPVTRRPASVVGGGAAFVVVRAAAVGVFCHP
jgi:hypothetical protein